MAKKNSTKELLNEITRAIAASRRKTAALHKSSMAKLDKFAPSRIGICYLDSIAFNNSTLKQILVFREGKNVGAIWARKFETDRNRTWGFSRTNGYHSDAEWFPTLKICKATAETKLRRKAATA
jgi:hypothetical protein